jgi:purine nucleosidase
LKLDADAVAEVAASGPLGVALKNEIGQWWAFHGHEWNNPHDPIAALTLIEPALFSSRRSDVEISDEGLTVDSANPDGRTDVVVSLDTAAVARAIVDRIAVNGTGPKRT